jgi:hypothetical protein
MSEGRITADLPIEIADEAALVRAANGMPSSALDRADDLHSTLFA